MVTDDIKCTKCGGIDISERVWCHANDREIGDVAEIWYKWDTRIENEDSIYWCHSCKDEVKICY